VEIRRFGVGQRRPGGPQGTSGVASAVIHADARGLVVELAFARRATIPPHSSPNSAWLVVVEGGGWVHVGDERARIAAGEAVLWPADVEHAVETELSEMRAFMVEFAGADDTAARGILEGRALELAAGDPPPSTDASGAPAGLGTATPRVPPAQGSLAPGSNAGASAAAEGEPL
jgi:quercetin dioxygenase-like cupin family protein